MPTLTEFEKLVSSCLIPEQAALQDGITLGRVKWLYKDMVMEDLPYRALGFDSAAELLGKVPNTIEVLRCNGEVLYKVKPPKAAVRVAKLVANQKPAPQRGKQPSCKPAPYNNYNNHNSNRPKFVPRTRTVFLRPFVPPSRPPKSPMKNSQSSMTTPRPTMGTLQQSVRRSQPQPSKRTVVAIYPSTQKPQHPPPPRRISTDGKNRGRTVLFKKAICDIVRENFPNRKVSYTKGSLHVTVPNWQNLVRPEQRKRGKQLPTQAKAFPQLGPTSPILSCDAHTGSPRDSITGASRDAETRASRYADSGLSHDSEIGSPRVSATGASRDVDSVTTRDPDSGPSHDTEIGSPRVFATGALCDVDFGTTRDPDSRPSRDTEIGSPRVFGTRASRDVDSGTTRDADSGPSRDTEIGSPRVFATGSLCVPAPDVKTVTCKMNIKKMLKENPNGLLLTSVHALYKKMFDCEPELDLKECIPKWKTVCEIEETIISPDQLIRIVYATVSTAKNGVIKSAMDLGETYSVYLCNTDSLDELYLQIAETKVDDFNTRLNDFFSNTKGKMLEKLRIGAFCIAPYSVLVYRGVIKQLKDDDCLVLFLDFGNKVWVAKKDVREIPEEFIDYPAQAIPCHLDGVHPMQHKQLESASQYFKKLLDFVNQKLFCEVVNFENGKYGVKLFHKSLEKSLNALIVDEFI